MNVDEFRFKTLGVEVLSRAEQILGVLHAAYREEGRLLGVASFPPLERTARQVRQASTTFFGLVSGEQIAAVAEIEDLGGEGFGISSFVVHPKFFSSGPWKPASGPPSGRALRL